MAFKTFVITRDERDNKTVFVKEAAEGGTSAAMQQAMSRYSDPNRYSTGVYKAKNWEDLKAGYPRFSDGRPE